MKKCLITLMCLGLCYGLLSTKTQEVGNRTISSPYSIEFSTRSTSGTISGLTGEVYLDFDDFSQTNIDVKADVSTIETGIALRNEHAMAPEWFDVQKFPYIFFKATQLSHQLEGYLLKGNLTLKGVTKAVEIPVEIIKNQYGETFSGKFLINRSDFNVAGKGIRSMIVGETVTITFNIPLTQKI